MTAIPFDKARFLCSANTLDQLPLVKGAKGTVLPEIAVVGRSNVGKSSLLNDLFQKKGLVKTSSTPGKTQLINFFRLEDSLLFVDLPGYGYAKAALSAKIHWGELIESYLKEREQLRGVLFLLDIRRIPSEEDFQMRQWLASSTLPTILVLTKVDKVSQSERKKQTDLILETLEAQHLPHVHYSVLHHEGRKPLIQLLSSCLN